VTTVPYLEAGAPTASRLGFRVPRPVVGPITCGSAAVVTGTCLGIALVNHRIEMFVAAAVIALVCAVFVANPLYGLAVTLFIRPTLDLWAGVTLVGVAGASRSLNAASLMALTFLIVGGSFAIENWRDSRRAPAALPFLAFIATATVSVLLGRYRSEGFTELVRLLSVGTIYLVAFASVCTRRDALRLMYAVIASAVFPVIYALHQLNASQLVSQRGFARVSSTFVAIDAFGIFMALVYIVVATLVVTRGVRFRWLIVAFLPFAGYTTIHSYARTGWIATIIGVGIVLALRNRRLLLVLPVAIVLVAAANPSVIHRFGDLQRTQATPTNAPANTFVGRVGRWQQALPQVKNNPITGRGLAFIVASNEGAAVHNDYVRAVVETGLVGLCAFLWLLVRTFRASYAGLRSARVWGGSVDLAIALGTFAVVPAWIIMSLDSNLMDQIVVAGVFWALAATGHALAYRRAYGAVTVD